MRYRVKHVAEYAGVRFVDALVNFLPHRAALALAWLVAAFSFYILRINVRRTTRRILSVFGDRYTAAQARRIAWQSWRGLVFNGVEMMRVGRIRRDWLNSVFESAHVITHVKRIIGTGRGAIIAVPHCGNWEMAAVACQLEGLPIFIITADQKNPLVNAYMQRKRNLPGIPSIRRSSDSIWEIIRRLRKREVLAILPDLRRRTEGIPIPFLGGIANIPPGAGLFAKMAGVPIVPCVVARRGWMRHEVRMMDTIEPDPTLDRDADVKRMMELLMRYFDESIRQDPGQWFWFNGRWILDPL